MANGASVGSSEFAGLTTATEKQTTLHLQQQAASVHSMHAIRPSIIYIGASTAERLDGTSCGVDADPFFSSSVPFFSSDVICRSPVLHITSTHFPSQTQSAGLHKRN